MIVAGVQLRAGMSLRDMLRAASELGCDVSRKDGHVVLRHTRGRPIQTVQNGRILESATHVVAWLKRVAREVQP